MAEGSHMLFKIFFTAAASVLPEPKPKAQAKKKTEDKKEADAAAGDETAAPAGLAVLNAARAKSQSGC